MFNAQCSMFKTLFVSAGTLSADVGLHLGRSASMRSSYVLFLLGFGLHLALPFMLRAFPAT